MIQNYINNIKKYQYRSLELKKYYSSISNILNDNKKELSKISFQQKIKHFNEFISMLFFLKDKFKRLELLKVENISESFFVTDDCLTFYSFSLKFNSCIQFFNKYKLNSCQEKEFIRLIAKELRIMGKNKCDIINSLNRHYFSLQNTFFLIVPEYKKNLELIKIEYLIKMKIEKEKKLEKKKIAAENKYDIRLASISIVEKDENIK